MSKAIEEGVITPKQDPKQLATILSNDFEWDLNEAKKIWSFGPNQSGPNMLVDVTKGVQYLNEIKDSVVAAF